MAGPDTLYEGMFRQSGIIRAASLTEMFDFCWVLGTLPLPANNRVMVQTHSGGPGATAADACDRDGLDLPELSQNTVDALRSFMPHTGTLGNPIDLTFSKSPMDYFADIPAVLLKEENIDILLVYFLAPSAFTERALKQMGLAPEKIVEESTKLAMEAADKFLDVVKAQGKPVAGFTYRSLGEAFTRHLVTRGIPVFPDPKRASRALRALLDYKAAVTGLSETGGR